MPSPDIQQKVIGAIETEIGMIARHKKVWIVTDMPKTRSGKLHAGAAGRDGTLETALSWTTPPNQPPEGAEVDGAGADDARDICALRLYTPNGTELVSATM